MTLPHGQTWKVEYKAVSAETKNARDKSQALNIYRSMILENILSAQKVRVVVVYDLVDEVFVGIV
jgi:hypothetical protein